MEIKFQIISAVLLTTTLSTANASPGEDEYISAEKLEKDLTLKIKALADNYPGPTATKTISTVKEIKEYQTLLATSAQKGFPPAMYRTAQILGNEPKSMYKNKTEICNLLALAAEQNLLAAKHGYFFFCSPNKILFSLGTEAASNSMKPLDKAIELDDPYKGFYPLPTIKQPLCHIGNPTSIPNASNPFTLITSTTKPTLSYNEYLADIHLLLYINQHKMTTSSAEQHKEKAKELNCAGVDFLQNGK